jgi:hypothetical protein
MANMMNLTIAEENLEKQNEYYSQSFVAACSAEAELVQGLCVAP